MVTTHHRAAVVSLFAGLLFTVACRKDEPAQVVLPAGAVGKCEAGIRKAITKPTVREVMSIYYDECADIYSEAGCKDAFHAAAHAEPKEQVSIVVQGCKSSYCPLLGAYSYEACNDNFQLTPESAMRAWPKLQQAILAHEAGAYSGEISSLMMALYAYTVHLGGVGADSASAGAAASGGPPGSAAPEASGTPPGSAEPAVSGAPPGSAAPPPSAGPATSAAPPPSSSTPTAAAKAKKPATKP